MRIEEEYKVVAFSFLFSFFFFFFENSRLRTVALKGYFPVILVSNVILSVFFPCN